MIGLNRQARMAAVRFAVGVLVAASAPLVLCGQTVQFSTMRPFVISVTPVIGPDGAIGGVAVDAEGVVRRQTDEDAARLRAVWRKLHKPVPAEAVREAALRSVSLKRLEAALREAAESGSPLTEEIFFLAGLQRVEYVFVYPDRRDVVLAGPAEGWQMTAAGDVVGVTTGRAVLRLDDLVEALRSGEAARAGGITCSIEPTAEGLERYARVTRSVRRRFSPATVGALQQALGPQRVLLRGVSHDSHFARVMVAADFLMKRLAMGFEAAPLPGMPSYMELLQATPAREPITSPRWWMTTAYEPLMRSDDGLAWRLRGQGVKTLTEEGRLDAQGQRQAVEDANPLAEQWADTMTTNYEALSTQLSAFGQLRNCMDLAVVAALVAKEDLLNRAGCELPLLLDGERLRGEQGNVPRSVESQVALVRGRGGWVVSFSGGVDIAPWPVLERVEVGQMERPSYGETAPGAEPSWWW